MSDFDFSQMKALIVEDNDFVRFTVKKNLMEFGFKAVFEAANGMEGIEQLSKHPDIVVCDINMEPVNGIEFLKLVRKSSDSTRHLPIIFLTSNADQTSVHKALELGVNAYLLKPVSPDALKKKVISLLSRLMEA